MMTMTYPDGTTELYDHGLRVQVQDGELVAATLTIPATAPPVALDADLGDARHIGYTWQKMVRRKWSRQLTGQDPILLDHGLVRISHDRPRFRSRRAEAGVV